MSVLCKYYAILWNSGIVNFCIGGFWNKSPTHKTTLPYLKLRDWSWKDGSEIKSNTALQEDLSSVLASVSGGSQVLCSHQFQKI